MAQRAQWIADRQMPARKTAVKRRSSSDFPPRRKASATPATAASASGTVSASGIASPR